MASASPGSSCAQGVLFHDRMKPDALESVRASLVAMEEAYLAAQPGATVQRVAPPKGAAASAANTPPAAGAAAAGKK
jgi:hypothetical protein